MDDPQVQETSSESSVEQGASVEVADAVEATGVESSAPSSQEPAQEPGFDWDAWDMDDFDAVPEPYRDVAQKVTARAKAVFDKENERIRGVLQALETDIVPISKYELAQKEREEALQRVALAEARSKYMEEELGRYAEELAQEDIRRAIANNPEVVAAYEEEINELFTQLADMDAKLPPGSNMTHMPKTEDIFRMAQLPKASRDALLLAIPVLSESAFEGLLQSLTPAVRKPPVPVSGVSQPTEALPPPPPPAPRKKTDADFAHLFIRGG